ncbi:hypothetical protein LIER_18770 [Lithospermum erythrorhizon]|uniref:NusG-like N-terminal domain-containing protein n=1 Tax=Lithospermum erythrorhizon TaxID=34254 RepID=A0AAV3QF76_LITER
MKQGLLTWSNPCPLSPLIKLPTKQPQFRHPTTFASVNENVLTAKERRQLRNERRERNVYNWKEEVEERLIKNPKKQYKSWTDELNLDNLALLGTQWWVVRVSRVMGHETAERLARTMARNFPDIHFQVYAPAVHVKRKLKNGTLSVKPKPMFPGCVFLRCVMNKDIHDFVRECDGVGGFVGSKVGNTKRQINKPRPVDTADMDAIFKQAKEEQEAADIAFVKEQEEEDSRASDDVESVASTKMKRRSKKALNSVAAVSTTGTDEKLLKPESSVKVVSGAFEGFSGILKKFDTKKGLATVGFTLFGKETLADLNINEIVAES